MIGIPADIAEKAMLIHLTGKNWMSIENYRKLVIFDADRIFLRGKCDCLEITGQHLTIPYYSDEEMIVTGNIKAVTYI